MGERDKGKEKNSQKKAPQHSLKEKRKAKQDKKNTQTSILGMKA